MTREWQKPWVHLLVFKAIWLCAVLLQNGGAWLLAGLILAKLWISPERRQDLRMAMLLAPLGIGLDLLLVWIQVFQFSEPWLPAWLLMLWLGFSLALERGLDWIGRLALPAQMLIGALAGSLSYYAGQRLGAVGFGLTIPQTLTLLAAAWALLLPSLFWLRRYINGK